MMKTICKFIAGVSAFVCMVPLFSFAPAAPVAYAAGEGEDYEYSIIDSGAEITKYTGDDGSVAIPDTLGGYPVTAVGNGAFADNPDLQAVHLPESLLTIGDSTFSGCINLKSVSLPSQLKHVGQYSFSGCETLQSINFPTNLEYIGEGAFSYCYNLASIDTIPVKVSFMGCGLFSRCKRIRDVYVDPDNPNFCTENGIIYSSDKTQVVFCPAGITGRVTIPEGITTIGTVFQQCEFIRQIDLPSTITAIENEAFSGCSSLEGIDIPNGVHSIGESAFRKCVSLKTISIPESVSEIGSGAFDGCEHIEIFRVDSNNAQYCSADGMLLDKSRTHLFDCVNTWTGSVTIPDTISLIEEVAFQNCPFITNFCVSTANENYSSKDGVLYNKSKTVLIQCPGARTGIFSILPSVEEVSFSSLDTCYGITDIMVEDGNDKYISVDGMLCDADSSCLLICPRGKAGSVTLPLSMENVDLGTFSGCSKLMNIFVEEGHPRYCSIDGILYDTLGGNLDLQYCPAGKAGVIKVPEPTVEISLDSFADCEAVTGLLLPGTLTHLSVLLCHNIEKVYFYGNAPLTIGDVFWPGNPNLHVYYLEGKTGFGSMWYGYPASTFDPNASFTVSYDTQGGSTLNSASVKFASNVTKPGDPEKIGYAIDGWYMEPELVHRWNFQSNIITENMTLFAGWKATNRTVTFVTNGGNAVPSRTVPNSSTFAAPTEPTREHYAFAGWYKEAACENAWDFSKDKVRSDITLYAKWGIARYTVSFNTMGGAAIPSQTVEYGATAVSPESPRKAGHACAGWYGDEAYTDKWNFSTDKVKSDITLYAKWSPNKYTVSFFSRGGSNVSDQTTNYGSKLKQPANPDRAGYSFTGWFRDDACMTPWSFESDRVEGDMALYAGWSINTYTIQFNSKGGNPVAPTAARYGASIEAPVRPIRACYDFCGWFSNSSCTRQWDFSVDTVKEDLILYAKWVAQTPSAYLAGISSSAGTLNRPFLATIYRYTLNLGENDAGVTVTPARLYDGATMTINGKKVGSKYVSLVNGKRATLTIKLKSGKASKTYTLTVNRPKSTNNRLAALSVSVGALSPAFDPSVSDYRLVLPGSTGKVTITAKKGSTLAKLGPATQKISLRNGQTKTVKITVKAQSGASRTYRIIITRAK